MGITLVEKSGLVFTQLGKVLYRGFFDFDRIQVGDETIIFEVVPESMGGLMK